MNLYELLHNEFKWPKGKPIKVFESFAGVGAQAKALERLQVNHEIVGISEIDKDAIVSYAAIHCRLNDLIDAYDFPSKEDMVNILQSKDVGYDFKSEKHTINTRTNIKKVKKYYLSDQLSKNFGNISKIQADSLPNIDLFTYSFPCQDLSRAGKMKGMDKESQTRSGLLWEIERILEESIDSGKLPKILLMENVPEVIGTRNKNNFMKWFYKLEELGYQSYFRIVDASNHEIPQHRERCFMISILGDYYYSFPEKKPLETKLKELLEENVDIHYYLSYKTVKCFMDNTNHGGFIRRDMFTPYLPESKEVAKTITTRSGYRAGDNFIYAGIICINYIQKNGKRVSQTNRILDSEGIAVTLTCGYTGYYMVDDHPEGIDKVETDEIIGKVVVGDKELGVIGNRLVRRLTALEAFRLMGFDDQDVQEMMKAGVSENQMLKQAGNSIVVNVLQDLFYELFEQ